VGLKVHTGTRDGGLGRDLVLTAHLLRFLSAIAADAAGNDRLPGGLPR
jgi:hypothetical protein